MTKQLTIFILFVVLAALSISGCRSTKTIQTAITKKDSVITTVIVDREVDSAAVIDRILAKVSQSEIAYTSMLAKIKVDYTDQSGKTQNTMAFVRLIKDSLMWVSLTGALGIEGFRVLIKPDTVWVMDKLEKTISVRSISTLQDVTNLPIDFAALQSIMVGNPVYFSGNVTSYRSDGNTVSALSIGQYFKHLLSIDTVVNTITHSKLDDVEESRNRTCHIWLDGYINQQDRFFSTRREITVTEKNKLNVKLDFKQVSFDENLTFPFTIPKSYKEK